MACLEWVVQVGATSRASACHMSYLVGESGISTDTERDIHGDASTG
jgi:hypothetical protein